MVQYGVVWCGVDEYVDGDGEARGVWAEDVGEVGLAVCRTVALAARDALRLEARALGEGREVDGQVAPADAREGRRDAPRVLRPPPLQERVPQQVAPPPEPGDVLQHVLLEEHALPDTPLARTQRQEHQPVQQRPVVAHQHGALARRDRVPRPHQPRPEHVLPPVCQEHPVAVGCGVGCGCSMREVISEGGSVKRSVKKKCEKSEGGKSVKERGRGKE